MNTFFISCNSHIANCIFKCLYGTQLGGILLAESDQFVDDNQLDGILLAEPDQFVRDNQEIFIL